MPQKKEVLAVNWEDGMKLDESHFIQTSQYLEDSLRDIRAQGMTDHNFGLLRAGQLSMPSLSVQVDDDQVVVTNCSAITRDGYRIEIMDQEWAILRQPTTELLGTSSVPQGSDWYVIIMCRDKEWKKVGKPNPNEKKVRHPHLIPLYELHIIPTEQINNNTFWGSAIPIARIKGGYGGLQRDSSYIPPCTKLSVHPEMRRLHETYREQLQQIKLSCSEIINTIRDQRRKKNMAQYSEDIDFVCRSVYRSISSTSTRYKILLPDLPPVHWVTYFIQLAIDIRGAMKTTMKYKKELISYYDHIISYFQWNVYDEILEKVAVASYDHSHVRPLLSDIEKMLDAQVQFFTSLKGVDYELLGKYDPLTQDLPPTSARRSPQTTKPPTKDKKKIDIKKNRDWQQLDD